VLDRVLLEDHAMTATSHDFGKDILPRMIQRGERVYSWHYRGYWRDVGTLESYWDAHMDLLGTSPQYDLNDLGWLIHTRSENRPPAHVGTGVVLDDCLLAHGCRIQAGARVERSILSPGVRIEPNAIVRNSVVLGDCVIEQGAVIENAILDSRVRVGRGTKIGEAGKPLTVVGKSARLPPGLQIASSVVIGPDVIAADLEGVAEIAAGQSVTTKRKPHEL
jgi:glucose-1-phosphate adenylyltransferase